MSIRRAVSTALLLTWGLVAQSLDPNSITVSATRSVDIPVEQVQFRLTIVSEASVDSNTVGNALRAAGVANATLNSVNSTVGAEGVHLTWLFNTQSPYARLTEQFNTLGKAQATLAAGTPKLTMSYLLIGGSITDATIQEQRRKMLPDLLTDANTRATALANAAGFSLGPILSLADLNIVSGSFSACNTPTFVDTTGFNPALTTVPGGSTSSIQTFSFGITVRYALR